MLLFIQFLIKMKKNLVLMLSLALVVLLVGCGKGDQNTQNPDAENNEANPEIINEEELPEEEMEYHPEWVATSLTNEDLDHLEGTMTPLSYDYETYDLTTESISDSGTREFSSEEWQRLYIPEYDNMVDRNVISSSIEDDRIYTIVNITLVDGSNLQALYVHEPDTLLCRTISVPHESFTNFYSNFIYPADIDWYVAEEATEEEISEEVVEEVVEEAAEEAVETPDVE